MKNPKTIAEAIAQGLKAGDKITISFEVLSTIGGKLTVRNDQLNKLLKLPLTGELDPPPPPIDLKTMVYEFQGRRYELNFTTHETPKDGK